MEGRVVPLDGLEEVADCDFCIELLTDFADEGRLRGFAGLDLAAGKFPPTLPFAIASLGGEDLAVLDYDCRCDLDCLHQSISFDAVFIFWGI